MAEEVARLLKEKFSTSLKQIGPKLPANFSAEFQEIEKFIDRVCKKNLWSSATASRTLLRYLYNLNDALADCRIILERYEELTQNFSFLNRFQKMYLTGKMGPFLAKVRGKPRDLEAADGLNSSTLGMTIFPSARHTSLESVETHVLEGQLKALLADKGYKAIGISGIRGSENSALVQKVLNSPWVCKEFHPIVKVGLSDTHSEESGDVEATIINMLCELGSNVDKWSIVLESLEKLLMSQKYLIVFDDFFSGLGNANAEAGAHTIWHRLLDALPRDGGGKVIIITSHEKMAQKMVDDKNLIHLKPMNRGSCGPSTRSVHSNASQIDEIVGFDKQVKEIESSLSDNCCKAIGVYGMGGSGKTALVQKVLDSPNVYSVFSPIIWICLSDINSNDDEDTEITVIKHILCESRIDVDKWRRLDHGKTELLEILKKTLMSKKYLIVFDDVWAKKDFYANLGDTSPAVDAVGNRLSDALPRDGGGKIIVTSRLREVAENMVGKKNLIPMEPLDNESCRSIVEAEIGFLHYVRELESRLNHSGFETIGICEQWKSVNSTLTYKVLSSPSVREKFQPIICMSESHIYSRREETMRSRILKFLLEELKCNVEESRRADSETELLEIVTRSLSSKNYLIVIYNPDYYTSRDDGSSFLSNCLWLLQALRQNTCGTVIVNCWTMDGASYFGGGGNLIIVKTEVTINREYVTDEILDQCHGLPLAAKTLANIIQEKREKLDPYLYHSNYPSPYPYHYNYPSPSPSYLSPLVPPPSHPYPYPYPYPYHPPPPPPPPHPYSYPYPYPHPPPYPSPSPPYLSPLFHTSSHPYPYPHHYPPLDVLHLFSNDHP